VFTLLMGFGIAIMQPSNARLLREWLPQKLGLGSAVSTNGLLMGCTLGPLLTAPLIMPLLGQNWRLDLVFWSAPVLVTALLFLAFAPASPELTGHAAFTHARWWPDWKSARSWLLGITFGCNNAAFYGTNGFLPDYLASIDRGELIGLALVCLNGSQVVTSALLLMLADRLQDRVWAFFVFGLAPLIGIVGILAGTSAAALVVSAIIIGACLAVTFVITMVLMLLLSPPEDVHRITASMFTIAYALALVVPVLCGALWDVTGLPWAAFVPVGICSLVVTFIGAAMTRSRITKSSAGRCRRRA
jgi:CP family cyanate transporter-like MFS transporter